MSINTTDNVTEIRAYIGDFNDTSAYINASNMTLYVSRDNSSGYAVLEHNVGNGNGVFTDGGCNLSINETTWPSSGAGTNPFTGAGLTNTNTSIYFIVKLTIPATLSTDIFYSATITSLKVYPGRFV